MKKVLLIVLVPILLLALVSCEGDILTNVKNLMGGMGGNILIDNEIVVIDSSEEVAVVTDTITNIDPENPVLSEEEFDEVQQTLVELLQSPQKAPDLLEQLDENAGYDGTTNPPPAALADFLPPADVVAPEDLTQGDILAAVLISTLANDPIVQQLIADPNADIPEADLLNLASQALQVVDIVKQISSVDDIVIDDMLADFSSFLNRGTRALRALSREGEEGSQDDIFNYVQPIAQSIINAIGRNPADSTKVDPQGLQRLLISFSNMRSGYENAALALGGMVDKSAVEMELGDLVNYTLSVVLTEANKFFKASNDTLEKVLNELLPYLDGTAGMNVPPPAFIAEFETMLGVYNDNGGADGTYILNLYNAVSDNLLLFSAQVPGNQGLTDMLTQYVPEGLTGLSDLLDADN
ncbi:MAG: hypothetical protein GXY60_06925 [Spirochaetales bacterium]|nr:hypothetical protein [Spirochaetales bacterium]